MKKIACLALVTVFLFSCQKKIDRQSNDQPPQETYQRYEIDAFIKASVLKHGYFDWSMASDEMVWNALQQSDNVLSVGYKPATQSKDISARIDKINIKEQEWSQVKSKLISQIYDEEKKLRPDLTSDKVEVFAEEVLPVIDVYVKNISTVRMLRRSNLIRYVEPMGYEPDFMAKPTVSGIQSSSGCGSNNAVAGLVEGVDFISILPFAKQSWNYNYHSIAGAWNRTSGSGSKIMIIDTGISPYQTLFGSNFNNGLSSGRTFEKTVTLRKPGFLGFGYGSVETSPDDGCGHGTAMAGTAAAPRSTLGNSTGVAYNSNLLCVRASTDVLIDESRENKGVSDAFVLAGNRTDVKIVSMSMGRITSSSQLGDAVDYAYNRGKLIFCAGGTSFGWSAGWYGVVFPATKSNVNAVTGVKDNFSRCESCHDGSAIDFVVVMEKASNGRHPLTTDMNSFNPSTVGGSSVATATTAGIAALVWSQNPSWTRDQVLTKLIQSSSSYPSKGSSFGWGRINADLATSGN